MAVRFIPTGDLDINTDPSRLPSQLVDRLEISGAMVRCTNLNTDSPGVAKTRNGTSKINGSAMDQTTPNGIVEMGGYRYSFNGTKIYRDETSIATGLTSARWSAFKYNAYNVTTQSIFAANGIDRKRISGTTASEWGIDAPAAAPTLTSGGVLYAYSYSWEGTYHATTRSYQFGTTRSNYQCLYDWEENIAIADSTSWRYLWQFEGSDTYDITDRIGAVYTYCRKSGDTLECESNPSDPAYIESKSGIPITWAASSDSQITHVRIYRTLSGGATFYYAGEYAVGGLSGVVGVSDYALGSEVSYDHDRPPTGSVVAGPTYNGYCFLLKDNLLYFCKANQPEYWPATNFIEVGPPQETLRGIEIYNGVPYVASDIEIYMIQGSSAETFFPFPMKAKTGTLSDIGMLAVAGLGILHTQRDGYYAFASANDDSKASENKFGPIFRGETVGSVPATASSNMANCWAIVFHNKLWFGYPSSSATYPNNVIVTNLQTGRSVHYTLPDEIGAVTVDLTNIRLLGLDHAGYVRNLDDSSVTTDSGTAISWQIESKAFTDQLYKYFPRYAKYDVTVGSGATATASILLADAVIQTHSLTVSRQTKKRLIDGTNGDRLGARISGTGTISIREVEIE